MDKTVIGETSVRTRMELWDGQSTEVVMFWYPDKLRATCIQNDWYTNGTNEEYQSMLDFVSSNPPTIVNQYKVAKDILDHSDIHGTGLVDYIVFELHYNRVIVPFFNSNDIF